MAPPSMVPFAPVLGRSHEVLRLLCPAASSAHSAAASAAASVAADPRVSAVSSSRTFSPPAIVLTCRVEQEPRGQGAQASASRRAMVSGVSAVVCVAAVALLASSEGGPAPRGAFAGPAELTVRPRPAPSSALAVFAGYCADPRCATRSDSRPQAAGCRSFRGPLLQRTTKCFLPRSMRRWRQSRMRGATSARS
jgi:hypothetical protein